MKKSISALLIFIYTFCIFSSVSAFTFPEPDWGALYKEREKMVTTVDFELYAEGDIYSGPYFWEKFEPRGTYIGSVIDTAQKLLPLGSYLTTLNAMDRTDLYYPANVRMKEDNVVGMIGWVIYDLTTIDYNTIRTTLQTLNSYNRPMLIRFANEMNVSTLGDDPEKYKTIFRKVANMVHEYENLGMVWAPNDLGALDRPYDYYYPGNEYVDWVGVSMYMVKYFMGNKNTAEKDKVFFMTDEYSWATNRLKPIIDFMQKNKIYKPVMLSECGVTTANSYGEDMTVWATQRLNNLFWYVNMKYPQVKMINYFDYNMKNEVETFDISKYQYAVDIFNKAKNNGSYITQYGKNAQFVYQPANNAGTLVAKNNIINLYTLAYFPHQPNITVNYFIDGKWSGASNSIPYMYKLDISSMADGKHTLKISSVSSKEYVFYKNGSCICFGKEPDPEIVAKVNRIHVTINGKEVTFDQPPVLKDGRTLVPVRAIFEQMGAKVEWNNAEQKATIKKDGITVTLSIGNKNMNVNNTVKVLDVPAQLIGGRTLVPARAIAESIGAKVEWNNTTKTVVITY